MKREIQWEEPPWPDETARRRAMLIRVTLALAALIGLAAGIWMASHS